MLLGSTNLCTVSGGNANTFRFGLARLWCENCRDFTLFTERSLFFTARLCIVRGFKLSEFVLFFFVVCAIVVVAASALLLLLLLQLIVGSFQ